MTEQKIEQAGSDNSEQALTGTDCEVPALDMDMTYTNDYTYFLELHQEVKCIKQSYLIVSDSNDVKS